MGEASTSSIPSGRCDHGYERNSGDFKLKVDIPFFSSNLNIEDFIDWIVEIDKLFDYMKVPEEKRVKLMACRLKGGASAGENLVSDEATVKERFPSYEQILFQQY